MMHPLGDDVDCEPASNSRFRCLCKVLGVALMAIFVIGFLILMTEPLDDKENEKPSDCDKLCTGGCEVKLGEKAKEEIRSLIQKEIQTSKKICSKNNRMNPEQMRSIIKDEIKRHYRVSLKPDFASSSAGGMILSASRTWTEGYSYVYFLFIPLRSTAPAPSIILEATRQPGDCWPMEGCQGYVVIQLAARTNVVGFTVEHIDAAMSLSGGTPEAPNKFSVYGLYRSNDPLSDGHHFGTYTYDNKGDEEAQYFRVQNVNRKSFLYVALEVLSNHGNEKYTCIYRFQVHGFIDRAYHCQDGP
ncbi:UNVERIFIED_CONTAM: hypothetical protein PYX00_007156 [Menopon gallinae]|uniref:SUN domain-containing protein n=1 Tax=Menopon gallinae TaxID=328185 RepID=A0AAW2HI72_9NEOP